MFMLSFYFTTIQCLVPRVILFALPMSFSLPDLFSRPHECYHNSSKL